MTPTQPIPHGRGVSGVNRWPGQPRRATPRHYRGYNMLRETYYSGADAAIIFFRCVLQLCVCSNSLRERGWVHRFHCSVGLCSLLRSLLVASCRYDSLPTYWLALKWHNDVVRPGTSIAFENCAPNIAQRVRESCSAAFADVSAH